MTWVFYLDSRSFNLDTKCKGIRNPISTGFFIINLLELCKLDIHFLAWEDSCSRLPKLIKPMWITWFWKIEKQNSVQMVWCGVLQVSATLLKSLGVVARSLGSNTTYISLLASFISRKKWCHLLTENSRWLDQNFVFFGYRKGLFLPH